MLDKLKNSFYNFMQGRYGMRGLDLLSKRLGQAFWILLGLAIILRIAGRSTRVPLVLAILVLVFNYYRLFSKNFSQRSKENQAYKDLETRIATPLIRLKRRAVGTKDHVYTTCSSCKTQVRLPRGKGKLKVTCPSCGHVFIKRT